MSASNGRIRFTPFCKVWIWWGMSPWVHTQGNTEKHIKLTTEQRGNKSLRLSSTSTFDSKKQCFIFCAKTCEIHVEKKKCRQASKNVIP